MRRRLPSLPHVLSLMCPIIGWTTSPVIGAAIHRIGIASIFAPRVSNILLTFAFWSANPNCMPMNPKLIFQICQKLRRGFFI